MATAPVRTVQNREGKRNFQTFPINAIYPGENPIKRRKKTLETGSFPLDLFLLFQSPPFPSIPLPRMVRFATWAALCVPGIPLLHKTRFPPPQKKKKKRKPMCASQCVGTKTYSILSFTHTQYRTRGGGASTEGERDRATKKEERKIDVEGHLSR